MPHLPMLVPLTRGDAQLAVEADVVSTLYARLDELRERTRRDLQRSQHEQTTGTPASVTEQEAFVRLYADRLAALAAAEQRLCFGRLDLRDGRSRYIGRIGLADDDQQPMLTDWRAPAAEAFYQATSADPRDDAVAVRDHQTDERVGAAVRLLEASFGVSAP